LLVHIIEPDYPGILELFRVLIKVRENDPKAAADVAHHYRHHHEKDEAFKAGIKTEDFIHVLNEHLSLFNDFQNANQPN
jgi:hypothetical protein